MKKSVYSFAASVMLALCTSLGWQANAQSVTFKPGPAVGEDVFVLNTYGCTPHGWQAPGETLNWDPYDEMSITEWTIYAGGCGNLTVKSLIRFTQMNTLPPGATITYAELRLYGVPTSAYAPQGNSWYTGTPYDNNIGQINRVDNTLATSNWIESTVTWNTQPTSLFAANQATIPATTLQWNNNFAIDVTGMTQDIWNDMASSLPNNGYELQLQVPSIYRNTLFASSDNANNTLWPELYIEYKLPCNANFDFCSSTPYPNTYNFTAEDPGQGYTYMWDFGDGTTAYGTSATHSYMVAGGYAACLYLLDQNQKVVCQECVKLCINDIVNPPKAKAAPASTTTTNAVTPAAPMAMQAKGTNVTLDNTINIINVYPNPTHSQLDVSLRLLRSSSVHYRVYDMLGKELMQGDSQMSEGTQKLSIDVNKLVSGNYMLEMQDKYSSTKYKFTKE